MTLNESSFCRLEKLAGADGVRKLRSSSVMIIGCGGVGSWAAEAVARSAVGRITLVDFDTVSRSNINRQLPALENTLGEYKTEIIAARMKLINPEAAVMTYNLKIEESNIPVLLADRPDFVIDAIDDVRAKCALINYCKEKDINIIVSTGSGNKTDPTMIKINDLGLTKQDPLARAVRNTLRKKFGFPKSGKFGIPCVCSEEIPRTAGSREEENSAGCKSFSGTLCCVTGSFGFACASFIVRKLLREI